MPLRLPRLRRRREPKPADGTMTLMEHLYELRRRLFFAVLGLFIGTVIGFIWYTVTIPPIPTLGDIMIHPYCAVPAQNRAQFVGGDADACQLLATTPFSILQVRLKSALLAGAVLSAPIWLAQLWGFVTPALYSRERKFAVVFVAAGSILFAAGAVLAYVVVSEGLTVLLGLGGDTTTSALDPDAYFSFLIAMLLIFGVSFELPLLLVMLNQVGVLSHAALAKARRYAFFGLVVFAGLVVPGNDPITMLALAVSLCIFYEVSVQIARVHDRRKAKRLAAAGLGELSDDEASALPADPAPVGTADVTSDDYAAPIADPTPIPRADPPPPPTRPAPPRTTDPTPPPARPDDLGDAT
nr:twin-arginine translocase subunit TatC [Nakamurella flava]